MSAKTSNPLLTTTEVARTLGIASRTVQLWAETGALKAWKTPGGHRRFYRDDVEQLKNEMLGQPMNTQASGSHNSEKSAEGRHKIILVEDEPDTLALYKLQLTGLEEQLEIITAYDGYEALYKIGKLKPGLIITDLNMPRMDGFHMIRSLRGFPDLQDTKIVVISALEQQDIDRNGGLPDEVEVHQKPVTAALIQDLVQQHLKLAGAR